MKPHSHWQSRARLAHERLRADGGEQDSTTTHEGYRPRREVAQYREGVRTGHITPAQYRAARERLLGEQEVQGDRPEVQPDG